MLVRYAVCVYVIACVLRVWCGACMCSVCAGCVELCCG